VLLSSFAVFAVGSLARPIGAIVLGRFIDRHGRRSGLLISVTLMVTASFGIAMLPAYASIGLLAPLLLVVLRLMQGFALGPELGGSATYLAESAPEGRRGLFASTYQSSVALGTLAVAGLISILHVFLDTAQMESFGWRIVLAVGGLVALGGLALRRTMPETDRASEDGAAPETTLRRPVAQPPRSHRTDSDHRQRRTRRHVRALLAAPIARTDVHPDHTGAGSTRQHDRVRRHAAGVAFPRPLV
jgi:MFS family permease